MLVTFNKQYSKQDIKPSKDSNFTKNQIAFMENYHMTTQIVGSKQVAEYTKTGVYGVRIIKVTGVVAPRLAYVTLN